MAFEVKRMTNETVTGHTELVDSCLRDAQGWVEETRDNMQLWNKASRDTDNVSGEKQEIMDSWKEWSGQMELVVSFNPSL